MRWSFKIGRIAGIDVYVHATFVLLLLWVGYVAYAAHHDYVEALYGLAFIICIFAIIVVHELAHSLTARRFGIKTRDIMLLPIGGVSSLERMPSDPRQELLVALAGPMVNVVLAAVFIAALFAVGWTIPSSQQQWMDDMTTFRGNLLFQLAAANVLLAFFNLLPAFPMDGGRVLRAFLALWMDYTQATQVAAEIGQLMAILFGIIGLFSGDFFLIFIALFVWIGAASEAGAVRYRLGLAGVPVSRAMIREFAKLAPHDSLGMAARQALDGFQDDFPIVNGEKVVGVLPRAELLAGLSEAGLDGIVEKYMRTDFSTAEPEEMLGPVFERLREGSCPVMPVIQKDRLVGLLTSGNISELLMFREAVRRRLPPSVSSSTQ